MQQSTTILNEQSFLRLKLDGFADEALAQIESKGCAAPFAADPRPLCKTDINFSSETKKIEEWKRA